MPVREATWVGHFAIFNFWRLVELVPPEDLNLSRAAMEPRSGLQPVDFQFVPISHEKGLKASHSNIPAPVKSKINLTNFRRKVDKG
jgi:hypothetical protein